MDAYYEGRDAFYDGVSLFDNPYDGTADEAEWDRGWESAQDDEDYYDRYDDTLSCGCCSCCGCSCDDESEEE